MNTITLARCHLANDKSASYQDICVDGEVLQAVLKREFPHVFKQGRYKETFMPIIDVNAEHIAACNYAQSPRIVPIYGCQDGCCIYVYVNVEITQAVIKWLDIVIDRYFLGAERSEQHDLMCLQRQASFAFSPAQYHKVFSAGTD